MKRTLNLVTPQLIISPRSLEYKLGLWRELQKDNIGDCCMFYSSCLNGFRRHTECVESPALELCLHYGKLKRTEMEREKSCRKDAGGLLSTAIMSISGIPSCVNTPEHCMEIKVHFHKSSSPLREDDSLSFSVSLRQTALKSFRGSWV